MTPGHAHHAVVEVEEGLERGVVDGPVVGHAVEAPHAKVRGAEAREVGAPVDRAPAHGAVHQRRDRRPRVVDRIVLGQPPHVRLGAPVGVAVELPVGLPVRIGAAGRPSRPARGTPRRCRRARASRRRRRRPRRRRSRARRPARGWGVFTAPVSQLPPRKSTDPATEPRPRPCRPPRGRSRAAAQARDGGDQADLPALGLGDRMQVHARAEEAEAPGDDGQTRQAETIHQP